MNDYEFYNDTTALDYDYAQWNDIEEREEKRYE